MKIVILAMFLAVAVSCSSTSEKSQSKGELLYSMGTNYLVNKEYTAALESLLEALKLMPKDSRVHNNLGMAYYFKGATDKAKEHLLRSIELDPTNGDAKNNLASIYFEENSLSQAETLYMDTIKDLAYPNQFRTYYNLGLLSLKKGDSKQGKEYLLKSSKENINYCPAHYQLGNISFEDEKYEEALKHFRDSTMGTCYNEPAPHYMYALTLMKLDRDGEALTKFEEITSRFTNTRYSTMALIKINQLKEQPIAKSAKRATSSLIETTNDDTNPTMMSPNF